MGWSGAVSIEVKCGDCGRVQVDPDMIEVHVNRRDDFALFVALCPRCGELVVGADRDVMRQGLGAGARRFELYPTDLPPLTLDDLLELRTWLASEQGLEEGRPLEADPS